MSSICPRRVIDNGSFCKWATSWSRNHVMKCLCCRISEFSIYSPSLRRRPIRASVIHLLFFRVLIRIMVIAASREEPRPSSPQSPSPAPPGYHWSNPWIDRKWNHSSMSWLWLGVSTQLDMPKTSPQGEGQTLILYHTGPVDQIPLTQSRGILQCSQSASLRVTPASWRGSWRRWSVIGHRITWIMAPV